MVTWIVLAVILLALLLLVLAVRPLLVRLPRLRRAVLALAEQRAQAESLRQAAVTLQGRIVALQQQAETAQGTLNVIKTKRGK